MARHGVARWYDRVDSDGRASPRLVTSIDQTTSASNPCTTRSRGAVGTEAVAASSGALPLASAAAVGTVRRMWHGVHSNGSQRW